MAHTVKQLADLAGLSTRTLHYYDEIGLLPPSIVAVNGYRLYKEPALARLQQILFYRELGLSLKDIKAILGTPGFDALAALQSHKKRLRRKADRLNALLWTVERTIKHIEAGETLSESDFFAGFDETKQAEYEKEVVERWGADNPAYLQSKERWGGYSQARRREIIAEGQSITRALASLTDRSPSDSDVQHWVKRQHEWVNHFWDCGTRQFEALGQGYATDPKFVSMYASYRPDLPQFIYAAIRHYVEVKA
jgi:DNA-binding transcriptional MerR regulator